MVLDLLPLTCSWLISKPTKNPVNRVSLQINKRKKNKPKKKKKRPKKKKRKEKKKELAPPFSPSGFFLKKWSNSKKSDCQKEKRTLPGDPASFSRFGMCYHPKQRERKGKEGRKRIFPLIPTPFPSKINFKHEKGVFFPTSFFKTPPCENGAKRQGLFFTFS